MADTETLTIASEAGRDYDAYLARPSGARATAVLVLHDMFGLNAPIRDYADGLAQHGFAVLVPNLFWRSEIPGVIPYDDAQHPAAWARLKALDLGVVTADMTTAVH
jgi:carboxymethylenebutenolidase